MPSLLGDRGTPQAPLRSRRAFAVSLIGHVALFVTIATVSLRTAIDLPSPHDPLAFINRSPAIQIVDVPAPPRGGAPKRPDSQLAPSTSGPSTTGPTVPLVAPDRISDGDGTHDPVIGPGPGSLNGPETKNPGVPDGSELGGRIIPPPPPPPPAPPRVPIRLHSGIAPPVKTTDIAPVYPPIAQSARVQGVVILEAIISETGQVESLRVLRSVPLLDDAAMTAVRQWRYRPAIVSGTPTPVIITITVDFRLAP